MVHLLSNDTIFPADGQGNHTPLNYLAIIDNNKRVIVTIGSRDAAWYTSLKRFWNSRLFPQLTGSLDSDQELIDIGMDDEIEDILQRLQLENAELAVQPPPHALQQDPFTAANENGSYIELQHTCS